MATEQHFSIHNLSRPISPYPGDGICPTSVQFYNVARMSHKHWSSLGSDMTDCTSIPCTADCILDLLRHVPAFYSQRSKTFSILDEPFPQVKYAFEWVTTADVTCEQPVKRTYHQQILGIVKPVGYDFIYTPRDSSILAWNRSWPSPIFILSHLRLDIYSLLTLGGNSPRRRRKGLSPTE